MRAVGSKMGANSYNFRNDAALWETMKLSVCVTLALQYWAMSLLDISEELSWCMVHEVVMVHAPWTSCSLVQAPGSDDFFPM